MKHLQVRVCVDDVEYATSRLSPIRDYPPFPAHIAWETHPLRMEYEAHLHELSEGQETADLIAEQEGAELIGR
jgi:hypothetical protein